MTKMTFYEKPGCINNHQQKKLLQQNGFQLEEKNILTEPWTAAKLLAFFSGLPVDAWFNRSAPSVKSGEINPDLLTAEEAISCMLQNPLLIRRPLIEIGGMRIVGFESDQMCNVIESNASDDTSYTSCPREEAARLA